MKFGTFDIESNDWIRFEALGCFDGSDYYLFDSVKKFLSHISKRRYNGFRWYAHNGGRFDFLFLFEDIFNRNWKYSLIETAGSVISIEITTANGVHFYICDSFALLKSSLKKLTHAFNVKHKKIELDVTKGVSILSKRDMKYLEFDCLGLYECLEKFQDLMGGTDLKLTIASQALSVFKGMIGDSNLFTLENAVENDFRSNYYSGGRVEVFKGYGEDLHVYDVNSLFPFSMLEAMPTGEAKRTRTFQKDYIGFYEVEILSTPDFYIPPYLVKVPVTPEVNKNYYVNGKGVYYFSSETLNYLRSTFGIRYRVLHGYYFKGKEYIFNDYVEKYFDIKRNNPDSALREIAKLLLNALYGKFAQKRNHATIANYIPYSAESYADFNAEFNLVLYMKTSNSKFILPYLSAYITDLSRLHHFKLMQEFPESIYYCDTDSIFTTSRKYDKHVSKEIGDLSYKGKFDGIFISSKMYCLREEIQKAEIRNGKKLRKGMLIDHVTAKGFASRDQFSFEDFRGELNNMLSGKEFESTLTTEGEKVLSFRECLSRVNNIKSEEGKFLKLVNTKRTIKTKYGKRKIIPSRKAVFDTVAFSNSEIQQLIKKGKKKK